MKSFGDMLLCLFQDVGDVRAPAVVFERAKRGIHNGDGKISVVRAELTGLSGSTTLRKHFELLAKHVTFGNFQFFALRVAVLASLNIQRGKDGYAKREELDRKSTRLNSSHVSISYAVFCFKKKKTTLSLVLYILHV